MPSLRLLPSLILLVTAGILAAFDGVVAGLVALIGGALALAALSRRGAFTTAVVDGGPVEAGAVATAPIKTGPIETGPIETGFVGARAIDTTDPATLVDAVLDGIDRPVLLIEEGVVAIANEAALALLGRHIVGQDARLAIRHPAAAAALAAAPAAVSAAAEPVQLEGLGAINQLWEMRVVAIATGARIVTLSDRSAGVAAERMRTDFVANASHELRTPLASILGYVETLQGEAGEAAPVRARFLQVVFDEASRMQRLVQDLMSLSRVEADRFRAPAERIDLGQLAREVAAELSAAARGQDIALSIADPLPTVIGDGPQLSQLLHNIVGNALAYGRPGTPVTLTVASEAPDICLTVADQGEGIAAHHLPRLTERFYRADAGRSRAAGGTGLGLAICKHIVERHRGRLSIDSTPGVGTRVTVRLPAVTEPQ